MPSVLRTPREFADIPAAALLLPLVAGAAGAGLALGEVVPHPALAGLGALLVAGAAVLLAAWWRRGLARQLEASRALAAERVLHVQALANLYDAVVITDSGFRIRDWNRAAERMYGFARDEVVGRRLDEVFVTELAGGGGTAELMERVRREGRVQVDGRRQRKDGSWIEVRMLVSSALGEGGEVEAFIGVHRDMTEERRHEETIRAAQAQIELLSSRTPAGIFQCDAAERMVYLNEMLCALTDMPPERLLADGWLPAVNPADQARVVAAWRAALADGGTFRAEFRVGLTGAPVWVHATAMPLHDDEGRPVGVVGVMTDVTEARRIEAQLAKAERMGAVGTLAAGMAHEVNNPLACVTSGLAFAAAELQGREELREAAEALADAQVASERVACIVRELQTFSEARDDGEPVDPAEVAWAACAALPEAVRGRARFQVEAGEGLRAAVSRRQLQRILGHLLRNAFQAIREGRGGGSVCVETWGAPGHRVAVEVRDDGRGIPADQLRRVFEPFFTTRDVGQGPGLGLAVCHALVRAMGGEIEAESEAGRGTAIRLLLPASAGTGADPWRPPEPGEAEAAAERSAAAF